MKYAPGDGIGLYEKSKSSIYHFDGTTVARIAETEYFPVLLDYNNDGLTDFWIDSNKNGFKPDKVLTADISGRLIETNLTQSHLRNITIMSWKDRQADLAPECHL